jgi:pyruvate ferredoxin oxidoreductase beta subunit
MNSWSAASEIAAATLARFAKQFDKDGNPSATLQAAQQERLENWHLLQELAGLR